MSNAAPAVTTAAAETNDVPGGFARLASAVASFASSGSSMASRLNFRSRAARREADIKRLGESLDRMSDRQLAVLGLSREFLYSQLEDRYDALESRSEATSRLTSDQDRAPKAITHVA